MCTCADHHASVTVVNVQNSQNWARKPLPSPWPFCFHYCEQLIELLMNQLSSSPVCLSSSEWACRTEDFLWKFLSTQAINHCFTSELQTLVVKLMYSAPSCSLAWTPDHIPWAILGITVSANYFLLEMWYLGASVCMNALKPLLSATEIAGNPRQSFCWPLSESLLFCLCNSVASIKEMCRRGPASFDKLAWGASDFFSYSAYSWLCFVFKWWTRFVVV